MTKYLLIIWLIFGGYSCNRAEKSEPQIDTTIVKYEPNRIVKTEQFMNSDSLKKRISKIEYYYDNLLIKEIYRHNWTSEYECSVDGDYQYFYDKNKKLKFKYFIELLSGDTVKYCYKYYDNGLDYDMLIYDFRKRLKAGKPHGDVIMPENLTEKRIWLYDKSWEYKFNKQGKLIQRYQPIKDNSITVQNKFTLKYIDNRLQEENSFLNDTCLTWTEKYEYHIDEIIMTHDNLEKGGKWTIPIYYEITKQDKNGNIIVITELDEEKKLMRKYLKSYDDSNRLVRMECYDNHYKLRITHKLNYENVE